MRSPWPCAIGFALLSACAHRTVVPDLTVPHQVAERTEVVTWCGAPDAKLAKCRIVMEPGWWVASPQAVEP